MWTVERCSASDGQKASAVALGFGWGWRAEQSRGVGHRRGVDSKAGHLWCGPVDASRPCSSANKRRRGTSGEEEQLEPELEARFDVDHGQLFIAERPLHSRAVRRRYFTGHRELSFLSVHAGALGQENSNGEGGNGGRWLGTVLR